MEDCCYYGIELPEEESEIIPEGLAFQDQEEYYTDLSEYDLKYMPEVLLYREEDFRFDS